MNRIVIVGGGFAGVWSAASAARKRRDAGLTPDELPITLIEPQDRMVIRPRLYEPDPGDKAVALDRILRPIGVEHLRGFAREIVPAGRRVHVGSDRGAVALSYGRLVLAAGSRLRKAPFEGAEHLYDVDTIQAAVRLDEHLHRLAAPTAPGRFTAVVIGSGFTGLEVATELVGRMRAIAARSDAAGEVRVVLVERAGVVGPELGEGPRPAIERALAELGVVREHGTTVERVTPRGAQLRDGRLVPAATVVWTGGMRASALTRWIPGEHDALGRLAVEPTLRVRGVEGVFAAGDTAAAPVEDGHVTIQSCQHAHAMGRIAGLNAASDLLGEPLADFAPNPYVTCLDLGGGGAVFTTGWDRHVEMTGERAKALKRKINTAIRPPVDDADAILAAADHRAATRTPTRRDGGMTSPAPLGA